MKRGIVFLTRWQAAAVAIQVAAVAACGVLGWQLLHPVAAAGPLTIRHSVAPATLAPVPLPVLVPSVTAHSAGKSSGPGLEDLVGRVNRDDARLYRGQWATVQLVASATRDYLTRHVLPLLLAAAGGGTR